MSQQGAAEKLRDVGHRRRGKPSVLTCYLLSNEHSIATSGNLVRCANQPFGKTLLIKDSLTDRRKLTLFYVAEKRIDL